MPIPRLRSLSSNIQRWTASAGVSTLSAVHRSNISFASLHISQSFGAALPSTTSSSPHCQISTRCRGLFTRQHVGGTSADINRRQLSSSRRHNNNTLKDLAWYEKYLLLKAYKERKGDCLVPQSLVQEGDVKLGQWVAAQRLLSKRGRLSQNRREMLDDIGFSFDPRSDRWEGNFAILLQFKEREGHCNVPKDHKEGDVQLGAWLDTQRQAMKKGKLDDVYIQGLEEAGVSWEPQKDYWDRNYALLLKYKEREGHGNVPYKHQEDGVNLGTWLDAQRQAKKGNRGKIDDVHIQRLEEAGVSWNRKSIENDWDETLLCS